MNGIAPVDDAITFLELSGVYPPLAAGGALLVYVGGWILFLRKIEGLKDLVKRFRAVGEEWAGPAVRRTMAVLGSVTTLVLLSAFALNSFSFSNPQIKPPPGYTLEAAVDLSAKEHDRAALLTFQLERSQEVAVYLAREKIKAGYFEARLTGPGRFDRVLLYSENISGATDSVHFQDTLAPGTYRLLITSRGASGKIYI